MNITFSNKQLAKQLNVEKDLVKNHGALRAKKLKIILASLRAAAHLGVFGPPMSPPNRCHELANDRKGQLSFDLDHPYRLICKPIDDPLPMRPEGGLDWNKVTSIEILGIEDTHG